jgi:hypothetical protein
MKLDTRQILQTLIVAGILASVGTSLGAILDFRDLKAKVEKHDKQIPVIGSVVCELALHYKLPKSINKCQKMLNGMDK